GHLVVDVGIVLHRAGAERVKAVAHAVGAFFQRPVVAAEVALGYLRQPQRLFTLKPRLQGAVRHVQRRQYVHAAPGNALFKQQLHASTSPMAATNSSMSALLFISVAHHSMPPSTGSPARMPFSASAEISASLSTGQAVTNSWKNGPSCRGAKPILASSPRRYAALAWHWRATSRRPV